MMDESSRTLRGIVRYLPHSPHEAFMRRLSYLPVLAAPLLAAALVGCQGGRPAEPVASIPVDVTEGNYDTIDAAVKERKGKVVLIDFWATWCPPCRELFPHFVDLHKKYADRGLACISVSIDPAQGGMGRYRETNGRQRVFDFLKEKDATFPNFVLTTYHEEDEKFEARYGFIGRVPHKVLFDKAGKKVWDEEAKQLDDSALDRLIEAELAK
jgi:thiol-disulfide isomerase/thioredoxin